MAEKWFTRRNMAYVVRSDRVGAPGFLRELQQAVWSVNPNLPLASVQTLDEIQANSMAQTASIVPTGWVRLRVVVEGRKVQVYVGPLMEVTLGVRKLGQLVGGQVGLWVGNGSGGDFANLVVTPTK